MLLDKENLVVFSVMQGEVEMMMMILFLFEQDERANYILYHHLLIMFVYVEVAVKDFQYPMKIKVLIKMFLIFIKIRTILEALFCL